MILLLIISFHILILSKLNFFPYPELFVYPYLTNHGLLPYAQILDQHFPGLMFLPLNLNNLGMSTPAQAKIWQYGIVILTHLFLYILSKKIFKSKLLALIPNIFYFLWHPVMEGWVLWIDSFIPIFLLPSAIFIVKFFEKKKLKNLFFAGLLIGIAIVFKQVLLPLAAILTIYLLFKLRSLKAAMIFGVGVALPVMLMLFYLAFKGVLSDFIFWTVTFNLGTFARMGRKYPSWSDLQLLLKVYLPPLLVGLIYLVKKRRLEIMIAGIFFIFTLAFAYARYDPIHLAPSLPFLALLAPSVFLVFPRRFIEIILVLYLVPALVLAGHFYQINKGGRDLFFGDYERAVTEVVVEKTSKEDKIFAFAAIPHIYYLADRLPAGNVFAFPFPWFFVDGENKILEGLKNDPPKLVIRDPSAIVEGKVLVEWAPKIESFISSNYNLERVVNGVEILTRK